MAEREFLPEERFLRDVFAGQLSEQRLGAPFAADAEVMLGQLRQQIDVALDSLSYRERGIMEMRYGLRDGHAYTLAEAGYVFNLTRERIRQLQDRAMERFRYRANDLRKFVYHLDDWNPKQND